MSCCCWYYYLSGFPVGCQYVTDQNNNKFGPASSGGGGGGGESSSGLDEPMIIDGGKLEGYDDIVSTPLDRGPYFDVSASRVYKINR